MTTHTISLSDDEQMIIDWLTRIFNAENRSALTTTQFLQAQIPGLLRPHAKNFAAAREADILAAFRIADETVKTQVESSLQISKP